MMHSPRMTRSQASSVASSLPPTEAVRGTETGAEPTQAFLLEELRQLRAERERERQELQELRSQLTAAGEPMQLSRLQNNISSAEKLKPDVFDGTVPLRDYIGQFELIARANGWDNFVKTIQLAAHLRGKARTVLELWEEGMSFEELKSRLELRFGNRENFQNSYMQFSNRKQKLGEDFASLGEELERLARLAYPECSVEIRDKISCAQFIAALSDGFIKQTLQLENVTSLRNAIERAMTVQMIRETSFPCEENSKFSGQKFMFPQKRFENTGMGFFQGMGNRKGEKEVISEESFSKGKSRLGNFNNSFRNKRPNFVNEKGECWNCGKKGHFRADCPAFINQRPK